MEPALKTLLEKHGVAEEVQDKLIAPAVNVKTVAELSFAAMHPARLTVDDSGV